MTKQTVGATFAASKNKLIATFPPYVGRRLAAVALRLTRRPRAKWVAYYDANKNRVTINLSRLAGKDEEFLVMLLTHELLHAAAEHHRKKIRDRVQFRAGFRLELFSPRKRTKYEHLNEAFVALLTRRHTGRWDRYYLLEQLVLETLARKTGHRPLERAFFDGDFGQFVRHLDASFGPTASTEILGAFERRRFEKIQGFLRY